MKKAADELARFDPKKPPKNNIYPWFSGKCDRSKTQKLSVSSQWPRTKLTKWRKREKQRKRSKEQRKKKERQKLIGKRNWSNFSWLVAFSLLSFIIWPRLPNLWPRKTYLWSYHLRSLWQSARRNFWCETPVGRRWRTFALLWASRFFKVNRAILTSALSGNWRRV